MKRFSWFVVALVLASTPGHALAQAASDVGESTLVAVGRGARLAADDAVGTLVVVSGNAVVEGHARTVVVVGGDLRVSGIIDATLIAVESDVTLTRSSVVRGDLMVVRGELERESGSVVEGSITRNISVRLTWALTLVSVLLWLGITIALIVTGLVLVAIARRQIRGAGDLLTGAPGPVALATIVLATGLPAVAIAAMVTVVGTPLGLGLLLFVLPLLCIVGYVVASELLGRLLLRSTTPESPVPSPYASVLLGLSVFQLTSLIPAVGGVVVVLAAAYGAGGIALFAWRASRGVGLPGAAG